MARIRSIKPELRTSEVVASWPIPVRYFWVLLWGYADDHGRGKDNARLIKADAFPLDDDVTAAEVEEWMSLLAADGVIVRYQVGGERFFQVTNWLEHQRPQHPSASKIPDPEDAHETFVNASGGPTETFIPEQGAGSREREQGAGSARKRGTRIPEPFIVTADMRQWAIQEVPAVDVDASTRTFVDYWRAVTGRNATKLDWTSTWRNWLRRDAERRPQSRTTDTARATAILALASDRKELSA